MIKKKRLLLLLLDYYYYDNKGRFFQYLPNSALDFRLGQNAGPRDCGTAGLREKKSYFRFALRATCHCDPRALGLHSEQHVTKTQHGLVCGQVFIFMLETPSPAVPQSRTLS